MCSCCSRGRVPTAGLFPNVRLMNPLPVSQIDLRDDPKTIAKLNDMKEKPVAPEQGHKLAKEVCWGSEVVGVRPGVHG